MIVDPKRVEAVFAGVLEQPPAARAAYLAEACAGDPALRARVEALLKAHGQAGSFLANPLLEPVAQPSAEATRPEIAEAPTQGIEATGTAEPLVGTKVRYFGDYELGAEIARGGMGVVYRAKQVSLNRTVALKMILAGQLASEADVQRFHCEAEAAANLDHPNIVPIHEIGQHDGQHYFSMKLIDGTSLAQRAAGFVRDPKAAVKLLAKVARAVQDAHEHGILHRDLKPSNILLDAHGEPYVTDFGLAKHVDGQHAQHGQTGSGIIVGTPSYMAPEQARSEKSLTTAVDVYGLGAILYEMLTGRPPFRAETGLDTILQVLDRDPPHPRTLNSRIDRDLETICLKCLEKEPRNRYRSALALAEDLDRWLAGHPIQARPAGPVRKVFKWAKRNPTLAVLLVVLPLWYFNVRLPWEWAWLNWALIGMLLALGLSRLVLVCGKAMGKWPDARLDLANDGFLVPGTLIALGVLVLYPGEMADRKSLAYSIVAASLYWGFVIQWLWRRTHAGPLAVALRTQILLVVIFGLAFGVIFIGDLEDLIDVVQQGEKVLVHVAKQISSLSGHVFLFLLLAVGTEIRKQGCVTFFRYVSWPQVESYCWRHAKALDPNYNLFLRLNLRDNPLPLENVVPIAKRALVERTVKDHVPHSGKDITPDGAQDAATARDPLQPFALLEREPAERLALPALLLTISGIMQIVGSLVLMGMGLLVILSHQETWGILSILAAAVLTMASIAVGVIVMAGARKMRRLTNYRFCRAATFLAMLPLGYGFLLGLPFGIWALLVLRRPDVQAAFALNDRR